MAGRYKPYPEYKNSGVDWLGAVPTTWQAMPCRGVVRNKVEKNEGARNQNYLSLMANIGVVTYEDKGDVGNKKPEDLSKCKIVKVGNLVINSMNYAIGSYGMSAYDGVCSPVYIVLDATDAVLERRFALRVFENKPFQKYLSTFGNGILEHRAAIGWDDIKGAYIAVPPKDDQVAILNFLDLETAKIDTLIEKQQQLIQLLKEKRQAVISHAVTKGLSSLNGGPSIKMRDSGVEWLGEVPEHWTVCRIKQVAKLESGHTPDKKIDAYWVDCDIPWVSLNDSSQLKEVDYISDTAIYLNEKGIANSSARKLPERCVVFTRDASIGLAAITTRVMAVSQHIIAWICVNEKVIPEYLLLVFYAMKDELERYTFGATLKTIGMPDVNKLTAAFPCLEEQKQIIEYVFKAREKFDLLISKSEIAIKIIKERRTALISAAVTGKIDVRDWVAPSASPSHKEVAA